ncbi:MAG: hypothetical protein LC624_00605 [Halobacteriales archaeon]|nr:hypothetical protein [Halobacteriales archaeon]
MKPGLLIIGAAVLAVALAGCTGGGNFNVKQTEPLRIALEGAGVSSDIDQQTAPQKEIVVEKQTTVKVIRVDVTARQTSAQPSKVLIIVKDKDTGQALQQKEIDVQNTTQQSLIVNVQGNNNVVVVTQALQGAANVNVAAHDASATQTNGGTTSTSTNMTSSTDTTVTGGNVTGGNATGNTTSTATVDQATTTYP